MHRPIDRTRDAQQAEALRVPVEEGRGVFTPGWIAILAPCALERIHGHYLHVEATRIGPRFKGVARVVHVAGAERERRSDR